MVQAMTELVEQGDDVIVGEQRRARLAVDFTHTGIPEVRSLDDLYDQRVAHASEVDRFVSDKLFLSKTDFERMMQAKRRIDNEWREISRILEDAGRRRTKRASFKINPSIPTTDFAGRLRDAIDPPFVALTHVVLAPVTDIETFFQSILDIERYFYMSAAKVGYVLAVADRWVGQGARGVVPSHREWDRVDALLTDAYLERLHRAPAALKAVREATTSAAAGFNAVLKAALGRTPDDPGDVALADLRRFIPEPGDHTFLEAFQSRVHDDNARPPDQDWERVYNIMDVAQRVREGLRIPAAQRMTWLNLHARADATSAIADPGSTGSAVQRPWKLFGQSPPEDTKGGASVGTIGWAVTSPALLLAQDPTAPADVLWTSERFMYRNLSGMLVAGPTLVFGDGEGYVHFLDAAGGQTLLRLSTDGTPVVATPVAAGNTVLVVTRDGGLFAFRPS